MKRPLQATLLILSGLGLLHATVLTDLYLRYVRDWMRPLLIASGVVLLVLGLAEAWSARAGTEKQDDTHGHGDDGPGRDHTDDHGHDHSKVPRVAWLLFLPALSLLVYAPPSLGAYTAARQDTKPVVRQDGFDPLPATSPVPLTLRDFIGRVQQDREQSLKGRTVRMTGFVTPGEKGGAWYLTRLLISCCAADAQTVKIRVHGTPAPPADTWVTVVGTWHPTGTLGTPSAAPALDADTVTETTRPPNAYTDALPLPASR